MEKITSRQNPLLQSIRKLLSDGGFRRQTGLFVGEGNKLLGEALKWGVEVESVISAPDVTVPPVAGARRVETPADVLKSISDTQTPQGVLFTCRMPDTALPERLEPGRYLVLDGVQDPGNLGTIWRTADAFGADGLILTGACADPFSPKVVRATMGACFRLPVWKGEGTRVAELLKASGIPLYATALREDTVDAREADLKRSAVIIGSEGRGVSDEMLALAEKTIKLPMESKCESLNAAIAAAVLLWEGYR